MSPDHLADNVALTSTQQLYHGVFSSARAVIERVFGVIKGKWRILLKRMDNKFINVPMSIWHTAFCIISVTNWERNLMTTKF